MLSSLLVFVVLLIQRGHPQKWRVGESWVTYWGGDWQAVLEEIENEARAKELENRRKKYVKLVQAGYECDLGDHHLCFEQLCLNGECEIDSMIEQYEDNKAIIDDLNSDELGEAFDDQLSDSQNAGEL
jgi:hypothetical protein